MFFILKFNDPNNVGLLPPSLLASDWHQQLHDAVTVKANVGDFELNASSAYLKFSNLDEINSFVSTYKLTDPVLKEDISAWSTAHSTVWEWKYGETKDGVENPIDGLW